MGCWALKFDWAAIGSMFQGVSAIVVAIAAVVGLNAWRKQLQASKHQALAEDALSLVYRLRDAIDHMRQPWAFVGEMNKVERLEGESEASFEGRKHYGVVEVRYRLHADTATQLEAIRYRVSAVLGDEAASGVEDVLAVLRRVRNEASNAVRNKQLVVLAASRLTGARSDQSAKDYDIAHTRLAESESWICAVEGDGDPAAAALKSAVRRAEFALRDFAMMKPQRSHS